MDLIDQIFWLQQIGFSGTGGCTTNIDSGNRTGVKTQYGHPGLTLGVTGLTAGKAL